MNNVRILSLCDYSGRWPEPYRDAGHEVIQVDLKHGSDVRLFEHIRGEIHGVMCAPPCTEFAGSGARWWAGKEPHLLTDGLALVDACLRAVAIYNPDWWVLENPVGRLKRWLGPHTFTFNPNEYAGWLPDGEQEGEQYTKRTCLWGRFTSPEKKELPAIHGSMMWAKYGGKSERTKEARSLTPRGFARAFYKANL